MSVSLELKTEMNPRDFRNWLRGAPAGTMLPASVVFELIGKANEAPTLVTEGPASVSWREKIWTCPADTRLGVREAAEAIGRGKDFVHRHSGPKAGDRRIPSKKLDGHMVFRAADIRDWIVANEEGGGEADVMAESGRVARRRAPVGATVPQLSIERQRP